MIQLSRNYSLPEREEQIIPIKVIAVGSAGSNALDRVVLDGMDKSDLIAANTDAQSLASSVAAVKVQLGRSITRGLGTGGDHITNDISMGLRIPMARAEKLKIDEGSVILGNCLPGETVVLKDDSGFAGKEVERETLNTIIHLRVRETLDLLRRTLEEESFINFIGEGIFITGGCSLIRGIDNLAEEIFEIPARVAHAQTMSGLTSAFQNPQFSTAIGLIKYAQAVQAERPQRRGFGRIFSRFIPGMR